ncbi:hypothetical protein BH11PSE13_BH11PSE13_04860 [soil metagenome]
MYAGAAGATTGWATTAGAGDSTAGVAATTGGVAGAEVLLILSQPASINIEMQSAATAVLALVALFALLLSKPVDGWVMERFLESEVLSNQRSP